MHTCTCCFEDYLVKCSEDIQVNAQLAPTTDYKWVITDKFERQYEGTITTDADGFVPPILVTELPAGLLTEFSGEFGLQFFAVDDDCAPVHFKIAQVTDCIRFVVRAGTREKNNLGCSFE